MMNWRKPVLAAAVGGVLVILAIVSAGRFRRGELKYLTGAVLQLDPDPGKQLPVPNAKIDLSGDLSAGTATSDSSGFFRLKLKPGVRNGQTATLRLRHTEYRAMDIPEVLQDRPYVIRMVPVSQPNPAFEVPTKEIADVRVRFTMTSETTVNVGSAVKVFEVVNQGDVPCDRRSACSPDGKWKAAIGGASLDAGEGNSFRNARVSCIAGPCPFTKIEKDSFTAGGQHIGVSVRNWSDTASFLLEAEATHTVSNSGILQSFPVIFGRAMSFTLPAGAQGPSIEAALDGADVVFPLGPALQLSWATCGVNAVRNGARLYRCQLKPGYRFR